MNAVTPFIPTSTGKPYNPANWYWVVAGSTTNVYSSAQASYVPVSNADYVNWTSDGTVPTPIASEALLWDVLAQQYPDGIGPVNDPGQQAIAKRLTQKYLTLSGTLNSSSISTGTLVSAGGAGIAGNLFVGGTINGILGSFSGGTLAAARGGTGFSTYAVGDLLYGVTTTDLARLTGNITTSRKFLSQVGTGSAANAPGWNTLVAADLVVGSGGGTANFLRADGTWAVPPGAGVTPSALTKVDDTNVTLTLGGSPATALINAASLTLGWTGSLAPGRGGTGITTYTLGDLLYSSAANTLAKLAGNTGATKQFLSQTGTGTVSAAPAWSGIATTDLSSAAALTGVNDTNVTLTLGGTPATALLRATSLTLGWTGSLAVARGGTGATTLTGLLQGNGTGAFTTIANSSTVGQVLRVSGASTYAWTQLDTSDLSGAAALTKTDDTNVTLTLGGTPATSLLKAVSLTLGWAGLLSVARGGTGVGTITGLIQGNGTSAVTGIANSSTVGQVLRVTGVNTYGWGAVDLADTDAVTGRLPFANHPQGSGLSVLGVTGATTADLASIVGTADQVLRINAAGTALAFGALNLASATQFTGDLPYANLTPPSAANMLLGRGTTTGDWQEVTLGAGLKYTTTALGIDLAASYAWTGAHTWTANQSFGSGAAVTPDAPITVNNNTSSTVAPTTGTLLHMVNANTTATVFCLDAFAAPCNLIGRHASGTLASKTGTASGQTTFAMTAHGWDTSVYTTGAAIQFKALDTWTTGLHGMQIIFRSTPAGGTALADTVSINGAVDATSPTSAGMVLAGSCGLGVGGAVYAAREIKSTSSSLGVGYATGAGGSVTQATSISTGVTLNTICGRVITVAAATAAGAEDAFVLTNSALAADDVIVLCIKNYTGGGVPIVWASAVAAGSCIINISNMHASAALSAALTIGFAIVKAVIA